MTTDPFRAAARDAALLRTLFSGLGLPLATALGALLALPFVARALTPAEFGAFVTLSGIFAVLSVVDLGIGSTLTIQLSSHVAEGRHDAARTTVAAGLFVAGAIAGVIAVFGVAAAFLLPWHHILGTSDLGPASVRAAIIALGFSLSLFVLGSLGSRILIGLQRGSVANVWMAVATIGGGVASVAVATVDGPLYAYVLCALGVPAICGVILTWWVTMGRWMHAVHPNFRAVRLPELSALARSGGWFFVIASANTVSYQADVLIVASVMGAPAAGVFAVVARIFGLVVQAVYPALLQLTAAFADATVSGEQEWVRRRLMTSALLALTVSSCACLALAVGVAPLIRLVLTPELVPPMALVVAAAVWTTYSVATAPVYFLLHGLGLVRGHALMTLGVALINMPVSILFTVLWGLPGPLWGSLVATVFGAGIPTYLMFRNRGLLRANQV